MHLSFAARWPQLAVAGFVAVAAVWFIYHYWADGTRPSWWVKSPLVVLRMTAVAALLVMLAQPVLRLSHADRVRPNVILLVDNSDSMIRPDPRLPGGRAALEAAATGADPGGVARLTRLQRANALLNRAKAVQELSKRFNVRLYSFAAKAHQIGLPTDPKKLKVYQLALGPDAQTGDSTQMGSALRQPLDDLAGQPIAGAMVVSDGGSNLGEDPVTAADAVRLAGVRVSTLGLGDPTKTKDIAILSVLADDVVRVNNTVTVFAAVSQRGYAGRTITVTLKRNGVPVGTETLKLGPDDQKQEVRFNYVPTHGGQFFYTVETAVQPGEIASDNNKRSFPQTVISKKLKILYVENEPRYEYRYLRNAIMRDTTLDFGCLLLSGDNLNGGGEGNFPVKGFPNTEKELFDYDIIVLGDVPRSYFTETQLQAMRRFVEDRGASMLVIAGEEHMPNEYAGTPLEAVLPAVITASPEPVLTDEPFQWQLTPEGRRSPIMQLDDNETENARIWATLPGMFWAAGVPRVKPGATILTTHSTRRNADGLYPIVVYQPFGAGKCYLQLVDSTWRWRWRVGDRYFYRYWGQVFRTLTPKELPGNSRFVQLNADRSSYRLGQQVLLNARLLDAYYHPVKADAATAIVKTATGQEQKLAMKPTPGSPGLFTAQLLPDRIGKYEVTLNSPVTPGAKASAGFVVETEALERQRPELDEGLLRKVASAGGGKYYAPDQLAAWMRSLPDNGLTVRTEQEIELWDAPLLLVIFVTTLSLEWLVRKRTGLL
ncbi:MAG TPA: hypothetical protein VKT77_21920 [Chthonomonadaceae bacterium]|nr:hypothetical protein [Chthonomonadaceae bacterium]